MKASFSVKKMVYLAVLTSLTLVLSLFILIPIPATSGLVTVLDGGIYIAGLLFGGLAGGIVGGLTGLLVDLVSGYAIWAPFSFVIHGLQGIVFGYIIQKWGRGLISILSGLIVSGFIMVLGYALATGYLYGPGAGWASIPSNLLQVGFGSLVILVTHKKLWTLLKDKIK